MRKLGTQIAAVAAVLLAAAPTYAVRLPDTGQTKCYQLADPYVEIPCEGTGQDGAYDINPMSYTDNGNGTVTDNNTGLMWQQEDDSLTYSWYEASGTYHATGNPGAASVCGSYGGGGYSDWRLPTRGELLSIVDYGVVTPGPTIRPIFTNTQGKYWTNTNAAGFGDYSYHFYFGEGQYIFHDVAPGAAMYVRCVRGAQVPTVFQGNGNGTVTDTRVGLSWQQGDMGYLNWGEAIAYCENLVLAGRDDWRLPSFKELLSLQVESGHAAAGDSALFPGSHTSYWSSTTRASFPQWGLAARFQEGEWSLNYKSSRFDGGAMLYARCVRGGLPVSPEQVAPTVYQEPPAAPAGTTFVQRGTGFMPHGTATLHFFNPAGQEILPPVTRPVDGLGDFAVDYPSAPDKPVGSYTWWAVDDTTQKRSNEVTYEITSACALGTVASIYGRVYDADTKEAIVAANVAFVVNGAVAAQAETNVRGEYYLNSVMCGQDGQLVATATGYLAMEVPVLTRNDSSPLVQVLLLQHGTGIPVLLIPGAMGSGDNAVFPSLPKTTPATASRLHLLYINKWGSVRELLKSNGFCPWDLPWDWRVPLDQAYKIYLKGKIAEIRRKTGYGGKIPVVAHSMGGLMTRAYIQKDDVEALQDIGRFAMVGTPNLGSGMAYYIWEGGAPDIADRVKNPGMMQGPWWSEIYSRVLGSLWYSEGYHLLFGPFLSSRHRVNQFFVHNELPTLKQLMGTDPFLRDLVAADFKTVSDDNVNAWLNNLNADVHGMSADGSGGTIQTGLFIGGAQETVETIDVLPAASPGLWHDGFPVGRALGIGDGTVPYMSAHYPATAGWADLVANDASVEHMGLVDFYALEICSYVKGSACVAPSAPTVAGAAAPAPEERLSFRIEGPLHFVVTDPQGRRAGIDPATLAPLEEIPGVELGYTHSSGTLTVPAPADGTWQVAISGESDSDFAFSVSSFDGDGSQVFSKDLRGYYSGVPFGMQVTLAADGTPPVIVQEAHAAPGNVAASARGVVDWCGLFPCKKTLTSVNWLSSPEQDVAAYRIYTANSANPHFTLVHSVLAPLTVYDSPIGFSSSSSTPPTTFAVTAVLANGEESFFSSLALNNDRDHDGVSDADETRFGTNRDLPDTDGDGYSDGDELDAGSSPTDPNSIPVYPPDAQDDQARTGQGTAVTVGVLANDTDRNSDPLQVSAVGTPSHGTVSTDGIMVTYTPAAGFSGTDSFVYTVQDGTGGTDTAAVTVLVTPVLTARCAGALDGWVLEAAERAGRGGTLNARAGSILVGDDAADRQYRGILSFDTSALPGDAVITSVSLKIKRKGGKGTSPFTTHGALLVDVKRGTFSGNKVLRVTDFQAAATVARATTLPGTPTPGGWYAASLPAAAFGAVNTAGITQLRLRFAKDDDNDNRADYVALFSGNAAAADRPVLEIGYEVP